ncbi:hypothetical protein JTE90_010238 [Oedothorax gibbosus]|uniref:RING-type domain-containing protein n=1 Tax=Oedothorax gibbosus TaxID=931172 RepID=A0AAV6TMF6_9ARAC|nr:hypothetical protein JTE90_010238 [Oedothorax gibbosus]
MALYVWRDDRCRLHLTDCCAASPCQCREVLWQRTCPERPVLVVLVHGGKTYLLYVDERVGESSWYRWSLRVALCERHVPLVPSFCVMMPLGRHSSVRMVEFDRVPHLYECDGRSWCACTRTQLERGVLQLRTHVQGVSRGMWNDEPCSKSKLYPYDRETWERVLRRCIATVEDDHQPSEEDMVSIESLPILEILKPGLKCGVCRQDLEPDTLATQLPLCKHLHHERCLRHWLTRVNQCPICRRSVK